MGGLVFPHRGRVPVGGNLGINPRAWNQYGMGPKTDLAKRFAKMQISKGKKYGIRKYKQGKAYGIRKYKQGKTYLTNKLFGKKKSIKKKGGLGPMAAMMLAPMALPLLQGLLGGGRR